MAFDRDNNSTTSGSSFPYLLAPSLTTAQRDAITAPQPGFMLYNTTTNALNIYDGSAWQELKSSSASFIELE